MKKLSIMIAAVGMCAALSSAALAGGADGPFNSKADLVAYWSGQPGSTATQIYLDGFKVFQKFGFGPAYVQQYFSCGEYGIRTRCTGDAFAGFATVADARAGVSMTMTVYVDSHLTYNLSPYYWFDLKTCYGDSSFYGRVKYFVVDALVDGFGPPFPGQDCFQ